MGEAHSFRLACICLKLSLRVTPHFSKFGYFWFQQTNALFFQGMKQLLILQLPT